MLPRGAIVTALSLGALAAAGAPAAADGDVGAPAIAWDAPAGCPAADDVRARVATQLGRDVAPGEVTATLTVSRRGARWHVVMTTRTAAGEGERALDAASCDELASAAALILAMAIDLAREAAPAPPAPAPTDDDLAAIDVGDAPPEIPAFAARDERDDEVPPVPDLRRRQVDISEPAPRPPRAIALRARALAGGDLGTLPGPAIGWGAGVEVGAGDWSVDLVVHRFAAQRTDVPVRPGEMPKVVDVDLTTGGLRGCFTSSGRRWRTGGCLGGGVMVMTSRSQGFSEDLVRHPSGGSLHGGVVAVLRLVGPLAARLDVAMDLLVVRPVLVREGEVVHDPNAVVWRGFAGLEATWR